VIEDSGRQFRVNEGDVIDVDLRDIADDQKEIQFERVLLVSAEGDVKIGTPLVEGASVVGEVVDPEAKGEKIHTYYWRRRKGSQKKTGHRQRYVRVRIAKIQA